MFNFDSLFLTSASGRAEQVKVQDYFLYRSVSSSHEILSSTSSQWKALSAQRPLQGANVGPANSLHLNNRATHDWYVIRVDKEPRCCADKFHFFYGLCQIDRQVVTAPSMVAEHGHM